MIIVSAKTRGTRREPLQIELQLIKARASCRHCCPILYCTLLARQYKLPSLRKRSSKACHLGLSFARNHDATNVRHRLHIGQDEDCFIHLSMQSKWKICLQGSVLKTSLSSYPVKQMQHSLFIASSGVYFH
jgi:hypothetical protein